MTEEPNYYSILPANVRYDKRLMPNAKLLYAEITALCNMNGKCYATNDYFAKLFNVSKVSISKWINQLVEFGYLSSEIVYRGGTKEILNRYLSLVKYPIKEKFNTPIKEKFKENNTTNVDINITPTESNNISSISPLKENTFENQFEEFWKYYTPVKDKEGHFVSKGNRTECLKKYVKLLKEGVKHETIITNLERYLRYCQENGFSSCGAEVYLNQRRFENDYSGIGCVDSKARDIQRRPCSIVEIAAELTRESKYDDTDSIPI